MKLTSFDLPSSTSLLPFVVCLVPDLQTEAGKAFHDRALALSYELNTKRSSFYELSTAPDITDFRHSIPLCALAYGLVPRDLDSLTRPALIRDLKPLAKARPVIVPAGLVVKEAVPFWDRRQACGVKAEEPSLLTQERDEIQIGLSQTSALLALQKEVRDVLTRCLGRDKIQAPDGPEAPLHVKLWSRERNCLPRNLPPLSLPHEVPCRLAYGDTGRYGQVHRTTTSPLAFFGYSPPTQG